jgi:hypothetical protein
VRTALIVTVTEGVDLQPQAAFASRAMRTLGFDPRPLPTDFCTTREAFQTAVASANPAALVFVDALEWREIVATLSDCAREVSAAPILLLSSVPAAPAEADFPAGVTFVQDDGIAALAAALGAPRGDLDPRALALDYAVVGGRAALRRAMAASLFAEPRTVGLLARRPAVGAVAPTAALARLEAPVGAGPFVLDVEAALRPLDELGDAVAAVEWWDRSFDPASGALLRAVAGRGLRQSVRVLPAAASAAALKVLKRDGVTRVVFDCDALDGAPDARVPGAAAAASDVVRAARIATEAGLEVGILLVIGLPGEGATRFRERRAALQAAAAAQVRVVPFEPAGGTEAWTWCVAAEVWPPADQRWNRELYQPLRQPQAGEYAEVLEGALRLVAETAA